MVFKFYFLLIIYFILNIFCKLLYNNCDKEFNLNPNKKLDVLCVGMATYDLTFTVPRHPNPDEKYFASSYEECGGGPAANASIAVSRLGGKAAFSGYLGYDYFGKIHYDELIKNSINCNLISRNKFPTRLSMILAKPDGSRTVVTYEAKTPFIKKNYLKNLNLNKNKPKTILFDGHEPEISLILAKKAKSMSIITILDGGSVHKGTLTLLPYTDYLVCSEIFAKTYNPSQNLNETLDKLNKIVKNVIITLGKNGLIWKTNESSGKLKAYKINTIDTTGAGDTFHGAFSLGIAQNKELTKNLIFSSAAAALCCLKIGARSGIPGYKEVEKFIKKNKPLTKTNIN